LPWRATRFARRGASRYGLARALSAAKEASVAQRFEYSVETIRSSMVGDKMDSDSVEKVLNERAREGWQLKSLTATQVKGRVGPGGTEGLIAVFERPTGIA
jgi:hypothetical protein